MQKTKGEDLNLDRYYEYINNIIEERGQGSNEVRYSERGCEKHHIVPKCYGGGPDYVGGKQYDNIIGLYPEEHYKAHQLLSVMNPSEHRLAAAFGYMSNSSACTPEEYEISRSILVNCLKDKPQEEEANELRRNTMLSYELRGYTNGIDEIRLATCPDGGHAGRKPISESTREKMKLRPKPIGEKNGMFGKKNTPESNKKRSEGSSARKGYSNKTTDNNHEVFCLPEECPDGYVSGRLSKSRQRELKKLREDANG